eukprot:315986_1
MMGLMVIGLDIQLVLYHHLQLLVRIVMMIVKVVHIYMKMIINGSWNQVSKLLANDGAVNHRFGFSVSIAPSFALIGAYSDDSAYIYQNDNNGSWNQVSKLIANDGTDGDRFGYSVSIVPPFAIIG